MTRASHSLLHPVNNGKRSVMPEECFSILILGGKWGCSFSFCQIEAATGAETVDWRVYKALTWFFFRKVNVVPYQLCE